MPLFMALTALRDEHCADTMPVAAAGVSPDGSHLLTNSMDNTLRVWDVRPYAAANRCTKVWSL